MKKRMAAGIVAFAAAGVMSGSLPAVAEPLHWENTQYIYTYDSAGLTACKNYGPRAADEYNVSNWRCVAGQVGSTAKYRLQVLVR